MTLDTADLTTPSTPGKWKIDARGFQSESAAVEYAAGHRDDGPLRIRQTNRQRGRERWCVDRWREVFAPARHLAKESGGVPVPRATPGDRAGGRGRQVGQATRRVPIGLAPQESTR